MYKSTEILFEYSIKDFRLPVNFRMISSAHAKLGALEFEKFTPKFANEKWGHNKKLSYRHSVMFANQLKESLSNLKSGKMEWKTINMGRLIKVVNEHKKDIMTIG